MQASFHGKEQHILQEGKKNDLRRENKNREDSFHSNTVYLHRKIPLFLWRQLFGSWHEGALMRAWRSADLSSAASRNPYITLRVSIDTNWCRQGCKQHSQRNTRCISLVEVFPHNLQILPFLRAPGDQGSREGVMVFPWGRKSSLAQDRDITEHQAGIGFLDPKLSLGHSKHKTTHLLVFFLVFFTVPGSVVGSGLWNQPPLVCITCQNTDLSYLPNSVFNQD